MDDIARSVLLGGLLAVCLSPCLADEAAHFNPDTDPSRISWTELDKRLGPAPDVRGRRFGVVLKTQTNDYWRLMTMGYRKRAAADGVKLDIQAAQNESDPTRQLAIMENMVGGLYAALLISPQSSSNLQPAINDAVAANLPMVDVDGSVTDGVMHFVGSSNREIGVRVARWFIGHVPAGGKLAVVTGQAGVLSTVQRTAGFVDTVRSSKSFKIVSVVSGQWDRRQAYDQTIEILHRWPDLVGIYCNNDVMALGAVDAVKALTMSAHVRVFGTDGTRDAYTSIMAGGMTGTVDIFPALVGEIGLEVGERLSVGQMIPRVVATPQSIITRDNAALYAGSIDNVRKMLGRDANAPR